MDVADNRAARRAFIRAHHPDVGGDPARFIAELRMWDRRVTADLSAAEAPVLVRKGMVRVYVIPRQHWPVQVFNLLLRRSGFHSRPPRVH